MRLTAERTKRLRRSLELALNQEWPQLSSTRKELGTLAPHPIHALQQSAPNWMAIATVATDGGENRLRLEPILIQVIRVADSTGVIYFEDFVPQSFSPEEILRFFFQSNLTLNRFLDYLNLRWSELLPKSDFEKSHLLSMLRELMEWAALVKLAGQPPRKLLIRDGLLRSILLPEKVFGRLRDKLEVLTRKHGHLLVGVAKRSRVLNYLSVGIDMNESFRDAHASFLEIPPDLEKQAAPAQYRWVGGRAMGRLHVARLDAGDSIPLLPVDVASWQRDSVTEVMSMLHETARASFPLRGYPQPLLEAHEHARLGGLEIEFLERMLLEQLFERDSGVGRAARRLMLLGKQFAARSDENSYEP